MKRVIIMSWTKELTNRPVQNLIDSGDIEVVLWFDREGEKDFRTKDFHYVPDLMLDELNGMPVDPRTCYDNPVASFPAEFTRFCDIYSRVNFSKGQDYFDHVNLFHLYYQYFSQVIIEGDVDCVVFFEPPHSGADYMLYVAAKSHGIKTIVNFVSHVPNRFFCVTDLNDIGVFDTTPEGIGSPIELTIENKFEKNLFYMKNAKHKRGWKLSRLFRDLFVSSLSRYHPINLAGIIQKQAGRIRYTREFDRTAVHEVDYDRKYVYFPLHLQPELTTATLGGEFSDQLLAIEKLSKLLPDDWYIYVKENPKQGFQQRNRFFFERLRRVRNCVYIAETVSTYELTQHCQFVSSITGTACWEAISGGRPALIFGNAWFRRFPGITEYSEDVDLETVLNTSFTHEQLEARFSETLSKCPQGVIDSHYIQIYPEFSLENNDRALTDFLSKVI